VTSKSKACDPPRAFASTVQFVPFQCSATTVDCKTSPTASQFDMVTHEIAFSSEPPAVEFGLGTRDQLEPFHRSINELSPFAPTAKQFVVLKHFTPLR